MLEHSDGNEVSWIFYKHKVPRREQEVAEHAQTLCSTGCGNQVVSAMEYILTYNVYTHIPKYMHILGHLGECVSKSNVCERRITLHVDELLQL